MYTVYHNPIALTYDWVCEGPQGRTLGPPGMGWQPGFTLEEALSYARIMTAAGYVRGHSSPYRRRAA